MVKIFISYRRDDSAGYTGLLYEYLSRHFEADQIFRDIDDIEPGVDFVNVIERAVGSCDVLIAMIGTYWLTVTDSQGRRRLDNPKDFVRLEIKTALDRNIRVIPALVRGATMPSAKDLPPDLAPLARRNAIELSDTRFADDVERLVGNLKKALGLPKTPDRRYDPKQSETDPFTKEDSFQSDGQDLALPQLLPGVWQIQINVPTPFGVMPGQMTIEMYPNGFFRGQSQIIAAEGQWQISQLNQLVLNGTQTNGFQVAPYQVVIQFVQVSRHQLNGMTSGNEATTWQRIR